MSDSVRVRIDGKFFARGAERLRLRGATYGPFAPAADGTQFPEPATVRADFAKMKDAGINSLRTYHLPPERILELADEYDLNLLVDVPWPKHLCFLDSREAQEHARRAVREAAEVGSKHKCIVGYSVCNEIAPNIVRWHGAKRVERFIAELADVSKQHDPAGLVTYANFPPTEYLDLSFLDFATFNVYLHDREAFRKYLFRLQHIVGDRPLVLGELGMDTFRHGVEQQAEFLEGHVRKSILMGLAGTFVFSWTDDWHTGGHAIDNWAFGLTTKAREPKPSFHAVQSVYRATPTQLLDDTPRVSVVVCSYNGGRTLNDCLKSLASLDYPNYEVILVDDGSTDDTQSIARKFPTVTTIHQQNMGLSVARNVGLQHSTGEIIAYTDSDCIADVHWLTHLVYQFHRTNAAAAGGPNLSPDDGSMAACVAASPGQPTHVLESDQEAEHIPGCNMAFRRETLVAINGFDPIYRKAGDDVDVCWRLQQAGYWITFAPGAFVWHHRRQSPRAYLKQQAGYGEAEALLWFKHPDRFTSRGHGKWRGILYGDSLQGLTLSRPIIYRGTFAAGLFQTIYQPGPAHWAMLPSTLEWHAVIVALALMAIPFPVIGLAVGTMIAVSVLVALLQALQANLPPEHDSLRSRLLVAGLCYAQPLVRSWCRYRTRLFSDPEPAEAPKPLPEGRQSRMPLTGSRSVTYWSEAGVGRFELLDRVVKYLGENRWGKTLDSGWADWDLQVHCHPWTVVELRTAQEDHGGNHHLTRVNFRLRPSAYLNLLGITGGVAAGIALAYGLVGTVEPWVWSATVFASLCVIAGVVFWISGSRRASQVLAVVDREATALGLFRFGPNAPAQGAAKLSRRGLLPRITTTLLGARRSTPPVRSRSQPAIVVGEQPPVLALQSVAVTTDGESRA